MTHGTVLTRRQKQARANMARVVEMVDCVPKSHKCWGPEVGGDGNSIGVARNSKSDAIDHFHSLISPVRYRSSFYLLFLSLFSFLSLCSERTYMEFGVEHRHESTAAVLQ